MEESLEKINSMKKTTLLIHGNHEEEKTLKKLCKKYQYIKVYS
jgi:DNA repair exonuclease SbcCD nuclease subunit